MRWLRSVEIVRGGFCFRDEQQLYIVQNLTRGTHAVAKNNEEDRVVIAIVITIFLLAALTLLVVKNIVPPVY